MTKASKKIDRGASRQTTPTIANENANEKPMKKIPSQIAQILVSGVKLNQIWIENETETLHFGTGVYVKDRLASRADYERCDRCTSSIFECLEPGDHVVLSEGIFLLDDSLDLMEIQGSAAGR